jgi:hypothetical protein
MFEQTSRYADCKDLSINIKKIQTSVNEDIRGRGRATVATVEEEHVIRYKERRFIPPAEGMQILQEITYTAGDRLDLIAARALGDSEQFWRICDANEVMHPLDLTSEPGNVIRIAVPW